MFTQKSSNEFFAICQTVFFYFSNQKNTLSTCTATGGYIIRAERNAQTIQHVCNFICFNVFCSSVTVTCLRNSVASKYTNISIYTGIFTDSIFTRILYKAMYFFKLFHNKKYLLDVRTGGAGPWLLIIN